MKETWNLREAIRRIIDECAYDLNTATAVEIEDHLCEQIEKNHRCPHVASSDEGTSYCNLAESSVALMANQIFKLKEEIEKLRVYSAEMRARSCGHVVTDNSETLKNALNEIARLKGRLEAAHRVVEAASKACNSYNSDPEDEFWYNFQDLRTVLDAHALQMKDDSLGKKTEDTPQL